MQQLTALDQSFLALESDTTYGHVGSLALLDPSTVPDGDGELTLECLQGVLRDRLHLLPPMTRKLAKVPFNVDRPYWVDDEQFDLGYHVRELALPKPGSYAQLAEQVARIFARRLDRNRPLWEVYLIHNVEGDRVAVMTKIHHAAVDGMSGQEVMTVLYDLEPTGREVEGASAELVEASHPRRVGGPEMLGRAVVGAPLVPLRMARTAARLAPHVDVVPSMLGLPGAGAASKALSRVRKVALQDGNVLERPKLRAPRTPFSGKISPHRRFSFGSVSLSDVKAIKAHYGVKVNDVVVALTAGAVREWLIDHDALPDDPLLALVPVSVRTEEQRGTFGNRVSIMIAPIPTHIADPAERVLAAHEELKAAKDRHNAIPAQMLQDATTFIPPAIHARATRAAVQLSGQPRARPLFNLTISNVPGPPIPIYMAGAQLQALHPISVIADGSGLNVTIMSYRDQVDLGIVADREQMPDLDRLVEHFRAEVDELVARCKEGAAT